MTNESAISQLKFSHGGTDRLFPSSRPVAGCGKNHNQAVAIHEGKKFTRAKHGENLDTAAMTNGPFKL